MMTRKELRRARRHDTAADARRVVALALPAVLPLAMTRTFRVARDRLGDRRGYVVGFTTYWLACAGLSVSLLGRTGLRRLFREPRRGPVRRFVPVLLLWPPLGAVGTRLVPEIRLA